MTGPVEFICSHVAAHTLEMGASVTGLDDLSGGYLSNVPEGANFVEASVTDREAVGEIWRRYWPFDYVYHLGAYAAEGLPHVIN